jgi:cold shock CspA family protein
MEKGFVKTVKSSGFGFIETRRGIDFYFHSTKFHGDWKKLLAEFVSSPPDRKIEVEFEIDKTSTEAPRAIDVRLLP